MASFLPEKPILLYPSLAATIGLEEATLLSVLEDVTRHQQGEPSSNFDWHRVESAILNQHLPFWDNLDIQRISQRLRDLGLILLRSAPYNQSQTLEFAFNQRQHVNNQNPSANYRSIANHQQSQPSPRQLTPSASPIAANWQPDRETYIALGQLNIPEHFAREQIPEFVRYWRENGSSQRSWGSKFIQHTKRQWVYHSTRLAREQRESLLPDNWSPSQDLRVQIANEGIPEAFSNKVLNKFRLYHQRSGTKHLNWDIPFFSWVKDEWQKQDTPFIDNKKSTAMYADWQPDQHTLDYLNISYGIDRAFIQETIPEFIHKWIEKKAIYSEWGRIFAEHVIEQWRFVQAGIKRNPEKNIISKGWRPSGDCVDILQNQLGIHQAFIDSEIPEFILYWSNRAEAMHSWDNIFLRHLKHQWAKAHQGAHNQGKGLSNERQQTVTGSARTKDRSIAEQLNDTSWAS
jgi:hypothetical protein